MAVKIVYGFLAGVGLLAGVSAWAGFLLLGRWHLAARMVALALDGGVWLSGALADWHLARWRWRLGPLALARGPFALAITRLPWLCRPLHWLFRPPHWLFDLCIGSLPCWHLAPGPLTMFEA